MNKYVAQHLFHKGKAVNGLRIFPAIFLSILIVVTGFISFSYLLHSVNYPGFEQWLW